MQELFEDCSFRAPIGIGWGLDRAEPPITAIVTPADCSSAMIALDRDDLLGRINFAARRQAFLDVEFDRPVPPCPVHRTGLVAVRVGDAVHWRCQAGDFQCPVGGFGVEPRDDRWAARIKIRPGADEPAICEAAAPIQVEFEHVDPARTLRVHRSATETEPAHEALTLTGTMIPLAALHGRLHRAGATEPGDFLVDDTPVQLMAEHQLGPPGGPVVLDTTGTAFAEEGETVCYVGGYASSGPVRGQTELFAAGEIRVYEAAH